MEHTASAEIAKLHVIDPGEIRQIRLTLPESIEIKGKRYVLRDTMRPGTAFLAKPWGIRTHKYRRRMYTRSNSSCQEPGILETFINHTHRAQADTSIWWQSKVADDWYKTGKGIDVRLSVDESQGKVSLYENASMCKETNLRLEPDGDWEARRFVCLAFGTGITPFLSYIQYMRNQQWNQEREGARGHLTLIASVRHERQLMFHEELIAIAKEFPHCFQYVPVLTRSWPSDWSSLTGRVIRTRVSPSGKECVDLTPLLDLVQDLAQSDLRVCGSKSACTQLRQGLIERNIHPLSVRMESW